jgi:hypothetical protein
MAAKTKTLAKSAPQQGMSVVELALMLSLLIPLTVGALYWGSHLHRSWQLEEAGMAAALYVSKFEPAALIDQDLIDEQIRQRCEGFANILAQHIPGLRLNRCAIVDARSLEVELQAPAKGLLGATHHQSRWMIPN